MRGDVADVALAGTLFAPHYARALPRCVTAPSILLRAEPSAESEAVSELSCGETFSIVDRNDGWAWGFSTHDHYVGYVPAEALGLCRVASHVVDAPRAAVHAAADAASPVLRHLPIGARVIASGDGEFLAVDDGFVAASFLRPHHLPIVDPVTIAESLLGMPYLWGGRGGEGVDCSGLVQRAFGLGGFALPRDSDQQQADAGRALAPAEPLARGDLVFFPGHVGIMVDDLSIIHATRSAMAVIVEPLADLVARIAAEHDAPILARKRVTCP